MSGYNVDWGGVTLSLQLSTIVAPLGDAVCEREWTVWFFPLLFHMLWARRAQLERKQKQIFVLCCDLRPSDPIMIFQSGFLLLPSPGSLHYKTKPHRSAVIKQPALMTQSKLFFPLVWELHSAELLLSARGRNSMPSEARGMESYRPPDSHKTNTKKKCTIIKDTVLCILTFAQVYSLKKNPKIYLASIPLKHSLDSLKSVPFYPSHYLEGTVLFCFVCI